MSAPRVSAVQSGRPLFVDCNVVEPRYWRSLCKTGCCRRHSSERTPVDFLSECFSLGAACVDGAADGGFSRAGGSCVRLVRVVACGRSRRPSRWSAAADVGRCLRRGTGGGVPLTIHERLPTRASTPSVRAEAAAPQRLLTRLQAAPAGCSAHWSFVP